MNTIKLKAFGVIGLMTLMISCSDTGSKELADNALDGGRYFLENCNQGDFQKANIYLLDNPENQRYLKTISNTYFTLDKEGRQQLRQASIQINEVRAIDSSETIISYQSSMDTIPHQLKVISTPNGWKVDLKYTYIAK
jgi:hypothetical protein